MESCVASSPRPFLVMIVEGLVREVTGGWVEPSNWVLAEHYDPAHIFGLCTGVAKGLT